MALTDKQRLFVEEYLRDLNATAAARRAGYSDGNYGRQLLTIPNVAEAVEKAMEARAERTRVTADKVVKELARLAFTDMRKFVEWGPDGVTLKSSTDLSEDDAPAVTEVSESPGQYGSSLKIRLGHKDSSLRMLAEHTGIFGRQGAGVSVNVNVDARRTEDREQHFERLFAALDAYRAGADGSDGEGDRGVPVDSRRSDVQAT